MIAAPCTSHTMDRPRVIRCEVANFELRETFSSFLADFMSTNYGQQNVLNNRLIDFLSPREIAQSIKMDCKSTRSNAKHVQFNCNLEDPLATQSRHASRNFHSPLLGRQRAFSKVLHIQYTTSFHVSR